MLFGKILSILGGILSAFFLLILIVIIGTPNNSDPEIENIATVIVVLFLASGLAIFSLGRSRIKLHANYKLYKDAISSNYIESVEQLALAVGQSVVMVKKNLELQRIHYLILDLNFKKQSVAQPVKSPAAATAKIAVTCAGCGANNTVIAGVGGTCEYCGSSLKFP